MRATCPECGAIGHVAAFFADDDGKRLMAAVLDLPAELHRPTLSYLGLFKPPKNALSMQRATRLVGELKHLVAAGHVCRDERGDTRRSATGAMWAEGIEQMLTSRSGLSLPLANHNYLRAVVFGIADSTDAKAERAIEHQRQAGQHRAPQAARYVPSETPLERDIAVINHRFSLGQLTAEEADAERKAARQKHGA